MHIDHWESLIPRENWKNKSVSHHRSKYAFLDKLDKTKKQCYNKIWYYCSHFPMQLLDCCSSLSFLQFQCKSTIFRIIIITFYRTSWTDLHVSLPHIIIIIIIYFELQYSPLLYRWPRIGKIRSNLCWTNISTKLIYQTIEFSSKTRFYLTN